MFDRTITRRNVLGGLASAAVTGLTSPKPVQAAPRLAEDPFTLGVASGEPASDSVVLWTRLMFPDTGWVRKEQGPVDVRWQVFADEGLKREVAEGMVVAEAQSAHAVHVDVQGLQPDRWYWYVFEAGGHRSPVGRTRTFPRPGAGTSSARFSIASCQNYEDGFFVGYRHMADEQNDFVLHVGDYIYERGAIGAFPVREHRTGVPTTLEEYRARYALYRSDHDLQRAHAAFPWLVIWDDHEVDNDYAGAQSQDKHPRDFFLRRRAAAYKAFYEHMPLRRTARPHGSDLQLFRQVNFGSLASFFLLDCRQYRDPQACNPAHSGGSRVTGLCMELIDPARSMLGRRQERWLMDALKRATATWTVLAQTTLMAKLDRGRGAVERYSNDAWDGYPASRQRILDALAGGQTANPLVLGGDLHAFVVADLKRDFGTPAAQAIATEFVTTSMTSANPRYERYKPWLAKNPHIRHIDGRSRGYLSCQLTSDEAEVQLRAVTDVKDKGSAIKTIKRYRVAAGRPGAQEQL